MTVSRLLAGASGYSFKEWKGVFYPDKIDAERDAAVVCRAPADRRDQQHVLPDAQDQRCSSTGRRSRPPSFRFSIKASQRITHMARLKVESATEPLGYLYQNLAALGEKRGPVLFQLPPNLKKDLPRLTAFLDLLPADHRAAFEFRNDTWFDDDVYAALKGAGAALCLSEREDNAPPPLVETATWGYVRLRLELYSDDDLKEWVRKLEATSWRETFVYFMHEPTAPEYARKLMEFAPKR